jgi:hypothetical protein
MNGGSMAILHKYDVSPECVEKGRLWTDYILHLSSSFLMRKMEISKVIVSFDVLVALAHCSSFQQHLGEEPRLFQRSGEPAEVDMLPYFDKHFFTTPNEKLEIAVDFLAHPETIEFV